MLRTLVYLLIGLFVIMVVRMLAGVIFKGLGEALNPTQAARKQDVPAGGELKRDPVCGTFVPTSTSLTKTVGGETTYFCSAACRDKYAG